MSTNKVLLHLYDLSNGLAAQLSLQLTGKYIPAVWHSSIVVFGEEVYYGQGILRCRPGQSHHGMPVKTVDLGETYIDKDTFEEYLLSLSEVYTADKYHLLEFNCNNFTNDVTGFLTGGQIPQDVIDLPKEFLSTPFGASLRPTIDNMFRRSSAEGVPVGNGQAQPAPPLSNGGSIADTLHRVVQSAQHAGPSSNGISFPANGHTNGFSQQPTQLASSLSVATNLASFRSILSSKKCVAVMFTGEWCGPCKMVKPVFEDLAKRSTDETPVSFVLVDTTAGREIAQMYNISAVPTFKFFLNGKEQHEIKGADAGELRTQVQLLAMSGYPAHTHSKLKLPALKAMSTKPILFEAKPNFEAAIAKLESFSDAGDVKNAAEKAIPSLRQLTGTEGSKLDSNQIVNTFVNIDALLLALDASKCFPLFDILKYLVLEEQVSMVAAEALSQDSNIVRNILDKGSSSGSPSLGKPSTVTLLRLLCNCFASPLLASRLLSDIQLRSRISNILVQALLEEDTSVRTTAGSLAYNVTTWLRKQRHTWSDDKQSDQSGYAEQEDFEIELCSALIEALEREQTVEVAHRLLASLGQLFLHSPHAETGLGPVAQALELGRIVTSKQDLLKQNAEAQRLVKEVKDLVAV